MPRLSRCLVPPGAEFRAPSQALPVVRPDECGGPWALSHMHETEIAQALVCRVSDMFLVQQKDWSCAYLDAGG